MQAVRRGKRASISSNHHVHLVMCRWFIKNRYIFKSAKVRHRNTLMALIDTRAATRRACTALKTWHHGCYRLFLGARTNDAFTLNMRRTRTKANDNVPVTTSLNSILAISAGLSLETASRSVLLLSRGQQRMVLELLMIQHIFLARFPEIQIFP